MKLWPFADIVIDDDWDGIMSGAILLRASREARVHVTERDSLEETLATLSAEDEGSIAIADLSVNTRTWPAVERELERLSKRRRVAWYDSHEFMDGMEDPRQRYTQLILKPDAATARIIQWEMGDSSTERLARAAEMADQTRLSKTDRDLWKQVYLARPAVSAYGSRRGWLVDIVKRLAANPETDFRELPGLKERGIRVADEMWNAVASIHKSPSQVYENGRVAVWVEPRVPTSASRRPGVIAGGLARNRTAIVIFPSDKESGWLDIRCRMPYFWTTVDLRILDKPILRMGGYGSGARGATHWAIPRDRLAEFLSEVARLAPQLCGKPRGPVGNLPPRRKKYEDDESEGSQ